jgi:hypothetical protein
MRAVLAMDTYHYLKYSDLARTMIRVLTDDDNFNAVEVAQVHGRKQLWERWIHNIIAVFSLNKLVQSPDIRLFELCCESPVPIFV